MPFFKKNLSRKFISLILGTTLLTLTAVNFVLFSITKSSTERQKSIAQSALYIEQKNAQDALVKSLESKADIIGRFMAKTAADFVLVEDLQMLQIFQDEIKTDKEIAYALYLNAAKTAFIADEIPADKDGIVEHEYPISLQGSILGYVLLGMSVDLVELGTAASNKRIGNAIEAVNQQATKQEKRYIFVLSIEFISVSFVVLLAVSFLFRHMVIKPLHESTDLIEQLAQGEGDLTVTLPVQSQDEIGLLRLGVNRFVSKLRGIIGLIKNEMQKLDGEFKTVKKFSFELQENSREQQDRLQCVVTSMDELTFSIAEVSRSIHDTASSTQEGEQSVVRGQKELAIPAESIHVLTAEVEETGSVFAAYADQGKKHS